MVKPRLVATVGQDEASPMGKSTTNSASREAELAVHQVGPVSKVLVMLPMGPTDEGQGPFLQWAS